MNTETNRPLKWVPSAYFAMGLPFVILNMVCVLMFKGLGIADSQIALWTSIIMFPWTLKFLWSPLLELVSNKRIIVVTTQIVCGVGFACVALALHLPSFFAVCIGVLGVVAFSGATHDIALDGLYMAELSEQDQAKYIGWQGAFYNIAKLVATGLLVYLAGVLIDKSEAAGASLHEAALHAWTVIMAAAAVLLVILGIYHRFSLPAGLRRDDSVRKSAGEELKAVIGDFFTKKHIWLYIAFIILYRLGEGFVMKIVPLFLKADVAAGGLGLFMMQQVAPGKHQMAHYAFASAIMNLSVMVTGAVSGFLSDALGYKLFFIVVMLATVPIFILSRVVPFRDDKTNSQCNYE